MIEPLDLHNRASDLVFMANQAKDANNFMEYMTLTKEAFRLEREAALILKDKFEAEPTRSVLFRSAATLARRAGEYDESIRLVSYALIGRPHPEIRDELMDVLYSVAKERDGINEVEIIRNGYLQFLREKAINIKVQAKANNSHSRAIEVDAILETLKGIKSSISAYVEVAFRRHFKETDFNDFASTLSVVKKDHTPLCVNLSFQSFSASICVDDRVMSVADQPKILDWKEGLFDKFKADVIDVDYNSDISVRQLAQKFTPAERHDIYIPIIEAIRQKKKYEIIITDREFNPERKLEPIKKATLNILTPKIINLGEDQPKILVQSFAMSSDPNSVKKNQIFESHELTYGEFKRIINEVSFANEYLVVRNPFELKITYKKPDFAIDDHVFEVYTRAQSIEDVLSSYYRILIGLFKRLSVVSDEELVADERDLKERLTTTFSFSS